MEANKPREPFFHFRISKGVGVLTGNTYYIYAKKAKVAYHPKHCMLCNPPKELEALECIVKQL